MALGAASVVPHGLAFRSLDEERVSESSRREYVEDAVAGGGCCDPDDGEVGFDPAAEVEDKPVSRKEKWEAGSEWVCGVGGDREHNGERTCDRTLEADPQEEPPLRVATTG
jgi:hypothetical protein